MREMISTVAYNKMKTVSMFQWNVFIKSLLNKENSNTKTKTVVRQRASWVVLKMAGTSPEIFSSKGWNYRSANIVSNPLANFWVACNDYIGSNWKIKNKARLGPPPNNGSNKKKPKFSSSVEKVSTSDNRFNS